MARPEFAVRPAGRAGIRKERAPFGRDAFLIEKARLETRAIGRVYVSL